MVALLPVPRRTQLRSICGPSEGGIRIDVPQTTAGPVSVLGAVLGGTKRVSLAAKLKYSTLATQRASADGPEAPNLSIEAEPAPGMTFPMIARIVKRIANTPYARKAVEEKADLNAFKQKPTVRILLGVFLIGFSYVIGWPAVGALSGLAVYLNEPLVAVIGGPLTYGLSHLVFLAGMYLAGAKYSAIFLRWATRMLVEKWAGKHT